MRRVFVFLSAGLLAIASCSEPARESASRRGNDGGGSFDQALQQASVHSQGDTHPTNGSAEVHEEKHGKGTSDGEKHAAHENPNAVEHNGERHAHSDHGSHTVAGSETSASGNDYVPAHHSHVGQHHTHAHKQGAGSHPHRDHSDSTKGLTIGSHVPDFDVSINGRPWKLSELRKNTKITADGTLVLTFWCSFCHSCRHVEHPLDALAKKYNGRVGVIALDASAGETMENVSKFAEQQGLTLPIALDAKGAAADVFGVRVTTTTIVIDSDGVLRYRGQFSDNQHNFAEDALQAVLAGVDIPQKETPQKG